MEKIRKGYKNWTMTDIGDYLKKEKDKRICKK